MIYSMSGGLVTMNNENLPDSVPYIAHEAEIARQERHIKRLWIALIVAIVLLFASNVAWLVYESLFETISVEQDGDGLNNVNTGEQGDIDYEPKSDDQETEIR